MFDELEQENKIEDKQEQEDNLEVQEKNEEDGDLAGEEKKSLNDVEDIFSDKDGDSDEEENQVASFNKGKEKPDTFKPIDSNESQAISEETEEKNFSFVKIIITVIILGAFAGGGYFVYSKGLVTKFFQKKDSNEKELVIPEDENNTESKDANIQKLENKAIQEENKPKNNPVKEKVIPEKDTDGDGLSDAKERELGTNINSIDSDGDGLFDREEAMVYKTDPMNRDTDGDGFVDGAEVKDGYNPNGPGKLYDINQ